MILLVVALPLLSLKIWCVVRIVDTQMSATKVFGTHGMNQIQ